MHDMLIPLITYVEKLYYFDVEYVTEEQYDAAVQCT